MRFYILFLMGFLSSFGNANTPPGRIPDPIPGLKAALQFCGQIKDDEAMKACVQLESGANWITPEALPICSIQSFDDDRINCFKGIVDRQIRPEEVDVCKSMTFNDEKAQCLAEINRPFPYKTKLKIDPQPGRDEAAQLCKTFFFDQDKKTCLAILSGADLLTVDGVRFCKKQFSDHDKLGCLERLKNHFIVPEEVTLCGTVFTSEAQVQCLEGVQRKYQKIRP